MEKKKIIIYVESLKGAGGIERIVSQLVEEWKKIYEIKIFTKDNGETYFSSEFKGVKIISLSCHRSINMHNKFQRCWSTFINLFMSVRKISCIIKKEKFNYIYVTTPLNAFECFCAGIDSKKIIVSEHGSAFAVNRIYKFMKKIVYPRVKCVSVPNKMDVDVYKSYGVNTVYIPHLVKKIEYTKKYKYDKKIMLNVGRLTKDKQQELLIECWNDALIENDWELWIVGDGEEKKSLEAKIKELNLESKVKLFSSTKNIEEFYKKAIFFVLTSKYEGFGLVLVEAMSYALPCISFDCPSGPRDIIENNKNGFLIENNNKDAMIKTLKNITKMTDEDISLMANNSQKAIRDWDNDLILNKWKKIFND